MHRPIDRDAELEADIAPARRRSGRAEEVSAALIPLLRGTAASDLHEEPDQLSGSRGVIGWMLISVAFWVVLVAAIWLLT
jgi:hypothetical protein